MPEVIHQALSASGGWLGFDTFMHLALYAPSVGYYSRHSQKFGTMPSSGSDFVTAPELTPLFGQALAVQVAQALSATGTREVWEFGAGTGALADQILSALSARGISLSSYHIIDVSGTLMARQQQRLAAWGTTVQWHSALPERMEGVVVGNEVLDAMPVQLLARVDGQWFERGVQAVAGTDSSGETLQLCWSDRPTRLRPPTDIPGEHDVITEIHPQAEAFIRTLMRHLRRGAALFLDYGFPEHEYYHPQRIGGTVMCHQSHLADGNPLVAVGRKDITAHVNFTAMALAAQDEGDALMNAHNGDAALGVQVLGYTSQARFLMNCGLPALAVEAPLPERAAALKLINEHEMGELFKVLALGKGAYWEAQGFANGDRTHRL
jgi:SAM-dependent MidA family methyltransferase